MKKAKAKAPTTKAATKAKLKSVESDKIDLAHELRQNINVARNQIILSDLIAVSFNDSKPTKLETLLLNQLKMSCGLLKNIIEIHDSAAEVF